MVDAAKRNGRPIFGITLQYQNNGVLRTPKIRMIELKQAHTAEYLADILVDALNEYGISLNQVISITTDNGSNMVCMTKKIENMLLTDDNEQNSTPESARKNQQETTDTFEIDDTDLGDLDAAIANDETLLADLFDENDMYEEIINSMALNLRNRTGNDMLCTVPIKCAAHTLQLAVQDAIKSLSTSDQNLIELCRKAGQFLRLQTTGNEMHRLNMQCKLPSKDVPTRWSSTFIMVS